MVISFRLGFIGSYPRPLARRLVPRGCEGSHFSFRRRTPPPMRASFPGPASTEARFAPPCGIVRRGGGRATAADTHLLDIGAIQVQSAVARWARSVGLCSYALV